MGARSVRLWNNLVAAGLERRVSDRYLEQFVRVRKTRCDVADSDAGESDVARSVFDDDVFYQCAIDNDGNKRDV